MVLSLVECLIGFEHGVLHSWWGFPWLHIAIHILEQAGIYLFGVGVAALDASLLKPGRQGAEVRWLGGWLPFLHCPLPPAPSSNGDKADFLTAQAKTNFAPLRGDVGASMDVGSASDSGAGVFSFDGAEADPVQVPFGAAPVASTTGVGGETNYTNGNHRYSESLYSGGGGLEAALARGSYEHGSRHYADGGAANTGSPARPPLRRRADSPAPTTRGFAQPPAPGMLGADRW